MATAELNKSPGATRIDALLAARQPRTAVAAMIDILSKTATTFASAAGMALPDGDMLEKLASLLSRAAVACRNPALSARIQFVLPLIDLARPHISAKITDTGARLLAKAFFSAYPLLASTGLAQHVRLGAVLHAAATGKSMLALPSEETINSADPGKEHRVLIDPALAGALFCGTSGAWAGIGVLGSLSLSRGILCLAWLLVAFALVKIRKGDRVDVLFTKLRSPSMITGRTIAIVLCAVIALVTPLTSTTITTTQLGTQVTSTEYRSLATFLLDPRSDMFLLAVKACTIGIIGAALVVAILALACHREEGVEKAIQNNAVARLAITISCICAWATILAFLNSEGIWFPGVTWREGTEAMTVTVGFAWYVIGALGIIAA
nr:hypothetical protein [Candidatus Sigynarchaeota archaeon]